MSGLLHVQAARLLGAGAVFAADIHPWRLKAAEQFRGARASPVRRYWPRPCGRRTTAAWRTASSCALARPRLLRRPSRASRPAACLQLFAPTPPGYRPEIDLNRIWSEQIAITTTYGAAPLDLEEALALIRAGPHRGRGYGHPQAPARTGAGGFPPCRRSGGVAQGGAEALICTGSRILRGSAKGDSVIFRIAGHGTRGCGVSQGVPFENYGPARRKEVTTFQIATLVALGIQSAIALGVGSVQCFLIWKGLRQMERASEFREREGARRHEESMTALKALIERTAK